MRQNNAFRLALCGACAGTVTGLFGAGGGMVLVPTLCLVAGMNDRTVFPSSVCIILPICIVSLIGTWHTRGVDWAQALPYLPGSALGGLLAGKFGQKIPAVWLHRGLGALIIWGGIRYLC